MDRLEDVRLPGAVRTDERGDPRPERDVSAVVAAEVFEEESPDVQGSARYAERHHHVEVGLLVPDDADDAGRERAAELELHLGG
jgi:hypothetical protein